MRRLAAFVSIVILGLSSGLSVARRRAQEISAPPKKDGSVRFAVIGDSGTGEAASSAWPSSWRPRARGSRSSSR